MSRRTRRTIPGLAALVITVGLSAGAVAGEQTREGTEAEQPPPKQGGSQPQTAEVSGTILDHKEVEVKGTQTKSLVVLLETDGGARRMPVDLGPAQGMKKLSVKKGAQITVQGPVVMMQETPVLVATRVQQNGKSIRIDRLQQLTPPEPTRPSEEAPAQPPPPSPPVRPAEPQQQ